MKRRRVRRDHPPERSLPTRERELKLEVGGLVGRLYLSLPTRERELKRLGVGGEPEGGVSLPTRERELKRVDVVVELVNPSRSPRGSVN